MAGSKGRGAAGAEAGFNVLIERAALLDLLQRVAPAAEAKTTIPILATVRLEARKLDWIEATATDLDLQLTGRAFATVRGAGVACVNAAHLAGLAAALPAGAQVELRREGEMLALRSGRTTARFAVLHAEDFPHFSMAETSHDFALPVSGLADGLAQGGFAMARDETRYYLNGVFLHCRAAESGGALRFVSTDGHRLALAAHAAPEGAGGMPGVIVPARAVALLARLAAKAEGEALVEVGETRLRVAFNDGHLVLSTKLIDGLFPDYDRVIPDLAGRVPLPLSRATLAGAVKRVGIVAEDKTRAMRIEIERGALTLTSGIHGADEVSETLEAAYEGPALTIGFNGKYLAEALEHLPGGDAIELLCGGAEAPAILRAIGESSDLVVLMPMRV